MKRITALVLTLLLCLTPTVSAAEQGSLWQRPEGNGAYVTTRLPLLGAEELSWSASQSLGVRYADTGEPVALTSRRLQNHIFATVPVSEQHRPLEIFQGEEFSWTDVRYAPSGANNLNIRGVLLGDLSGRLHLTRTLTRAEAAVLVSRMLSLPGGSDIGYTDVPADAWYADEVAAVKDAGLLPSSSLFRPVEPMVRWELMDLIYRAFSLVGWVNRVEGTAADLDLRDAEEIPVQALTAYLSLNDRGVDLYTLVDGEEIADDGLPLPEFLAEPYKPATREDIINLLDNCLSRLPVYPHDAAVQWGFDRSMPVVDGSTSTYPYTRALYGALFQNNQNHPQYPEKHSKSHASYERLISGEVDALFAATKASQELESLAAASRVTLEYIPIAYDAMVFFSNAENSISGLTRQQIQDIYVRSAYDNWSGVSGPDAALLPYCRNTDSGSHALMERYFLEGGALSLHPNVTQVNVSTAMSSALTDVAAALVVDPPAYAIGYSVYYYYESMQMMMGDVTGNQLKLLEIDGVAPTEETIADGSYPLADYNYLVIRADAPADSPARRLAEFMVSPQGQAVVSNAGFGPLTP